MYGFNKLPVLSKGEHLYPGEGMCIMELVSFINREPFSDRPSCTDDRITTYMQNVNDTATDAERVKLLSVIDRMFHTGDMTWEQRVEVNGGMQRICPELKEMVTERSRILYDYATSTSRPVWDFLYRISLSEESIDVKLALLNRVLDMMDEVLGVMVTLPQNRAEIEKMLAEVQK